MINEFFIRRDPPFKITARSRYICNKYSTEKTSFEVQAAYEITEDIMIEAVRVCVDESIRDRKDQKKPSLIGVIATAEDYTIRYKYTHPDKFKPDERITQLFQSNAAKKLLKKVFYCEVTHVMDYKGDGFECEPDSEWDYLLKSRNVCSYHLTDSNKGCLFLGLAQRKLLYDRPPRNRKGNSSGIFSLFDIRKTARQIAGKSRIPFEASIGARELRTIEENLPFRITVYRKRNNEDIIDAIYKTRYPFERHKYSVFFILAGTTYLPITSLKPFLKQGILKKTGFLCTICHDFISSKDKVHKEQCLELCNFCKKLSILCPGEYDENNVVRCGRCNRDFKNNLCHRLHLEKDDRTMMSHTTRAKRFSCCDTYKRCLDCNQSYSMFYDRKTSHKCSGLTCFNCSQKYLSGTVHRCYLKSEKKSKFNRDRHYSYVFYDIETFKEDTPTNNFGFLFRPVVIVSQQVCTKCINTEIENDDYYCDGELGCGPRTRVFSDLNNCANLFLDFLDKFHKDTKKSNTVTVVSHNGSAFDNVIMFNSVLHRNDFEVSNVLKRQTSLLSMTLNNSIHFRDSCLYLKTSLKKMPKIFGIEDRLKKTDFPYNFLTEATWDYIGPIPDLSFFETDGKTPAEMEALYEYRLIKANHWNLRKELEDYCRTDTSILRICMTKYRQRFLDEWDVEIFLDCRTCASLCYRVYARHFMPDNALPLLSKKQGKIFSSDSMKAFNFLEHKLGVTIQSAVTTEGEYRLKIDGQLCYMDGRFIDHDGEENFISYHGCWYHSCFKCLEENRVNYRAGVSHLENFRNTKARDQMISRKYKHHVIWEHDLKSALNGEVDEDNILFGIDDYKRDFPEEFSRKYVDLDSGFIGGRVGSCAVYARANLPYPVPEGTEESVKVNVSSADTLPEGHVLHYVDITSLYSYVTMFCPMPKGYPVRYNNNNSISVDDYVTKLKKGEFFGITCLKILAPRDLYLPCLPYKHKKRIFFSLCRKCTEKQQQTICKHGENSRAFTSTYCTPEIELCLELGYKILAVYDHWDFEPTTELFVGYQKHFLKDKIQASKIPEEYKGKEYEYLQEVKEKMDIDLDLSDMKFNPTTRVISKFLVNSLWGKLSQSQKSQTTSIVEGCSNFNSIVNDPGHDILEVFTSECKAAIVYDKKSSDKSRPPKASLAISCMTTSHARVVLYRAMLKCKHKVVYWDTDSLIASSPINEPPVPLGNMIGDFTSELESLVPGAVGVEFCSLGPKCYSLKCQLRDGTFRFITRTKGISLRGDSGGVVNFDSMLDLINTDRNLIVPQKQFRRGHFNGVFFYEGQRTLRQTFNNNNHI